MPHGEIDAARAFGMSKGLILRRVILPQAIRISLPTFSGETIALLKATAIASTITVYELLRVANEAYAASYRFDECYISAAIVYIALSYVLTRAFYFAERQINKDRMPPRVLKVARPSSPRGREDATAWQRLAAFSNPLGIKELGKSATGTRVGPH